MLEDPNIDENMTYEVYLTKIETTHEEYMQLLRISERGIILILKRTVKERFINNYNPEHIRYWNANMDIQLALDTHAIITYIVSYVSKDETGLTKFMKEALQFTSNASMKEKLKALKKAYLSHRQMGMSEAVYKCNPGMKLRDSNIACIFVSTGFPENRSVFFRKIKDDFETEEPEDDLDEESDFQQTSESKSRVKIQGREGSYQQAISIHERYAGRPKSIEEMCLAQFATSYTYTSRLPKLIEFELDGSSVERSTQTIFNRDVLLPKYLKLQPEKLGSMRLRGFRQVLKIHNSKRKEGHEQHYSELLLYVPWRNEEEEFHRWSPEMCIERYHKEKEKIDLNRKTLYPGESALELMDSEEFELNKPTHVYDTLNAQGEQDKADDMEIGAVDDPAMESFGYLGNLMHQEEGGNGVPDDLKFKKICLPNDDELAALTRRLVPEQLKPFERVVDYCRNVVKSRNNLKFKVTPIRLIIHGGAGSGKSNTIRAIALQSEKILRKAGDNPNDPRVLLCAFTGKAARIIGKE